MQKSLFSMSYSGPSLSSRLAPRFLALSLSAAALCLAATPLTFAAPAEAESLLPAPPLPTAQTAIEKTPQTLINFMAPGQQAADSPASITGGAKAAEAEARLEAAEAQPAPTSNQATMVPTASGQAIAVDIANFEVVSKGLWRGAQPSHQAINKLAQSGVRTIIDLRYAGSGCTDEAAIAKNLGMNYINIPLGFEHPSMGNIAKFLAIVAKPSNQPVFVHCRQGADRTGTLVGIFRIMHDHWTFKEAYNEMRVHHFKPWLNNMKHMVAGCEGNSKLSKELTEMANKLEESEESSLNKNQISIKTVSARQL